MVSSLLTNSQSNRTHQKNTIRNLRLRKKPRQKSAQTEERQKPVPHENHHLLTETLIGFIYASLEINRTSPR